MTKSNFLLLVGYILSSVILTFGFAMAFGLSLVFASLFGDPTFFYLIIFGIPQLILIPLFLIFYFRDRRKIKEGRLVPESLSIKHYLIIFTTLIVFIGYIICLYIFSVGNLILLSRKSELLNNENSCYSKNTIADLDTEFKGDGFTLKYPHYIPKEDINWVDEQGEKTQLYLESKHLLLAPSVSLWVQSFVDNDETYLGEIEKTSPFAPCNLGFDANIDHSEFLRINNYSITADLKFPSYNQNKNALRLNCESNDPSICRILVPQILSTIRFTE